MRDGEGDEGWGGGRGMRRGIRDGDLGIRDGDDGRGMGGGGVSSGMRTSQNERCTVTTVSGKLVTMYQPRHNVFNQLNYPRENLKCRGWMIVKIC